MTTTAQDQDRYATVIYRKTSGMCMTPRFKHFATAAAMHQWFAANVDTDLVEVVETRVYTS